MDAAMCTYIYVFYLLHSDTTGIFDYTGVDKVDDLTKNGNVIAFHGKTALDKTGTLTTAGGRILTVVGCEKSLLEAMTSAYYACTKVNFRGIRYRRDIALRAVSR